MIPISGQWSPASVNTTILQVRYGEEQAVSLNLDGGFAVASFIIVVYDWGKQDNAFWEYHYWYHIVFSSTDIRTGGRSMWLLGEPSHWECPIVWTDLGEQTRSHNCWIMHLILGKRQRWSLITVLYLFVCSVWLCECSFRVYWLQMR